MKVTIEIANQSEAVEMLKAGAYVTLFEDLLGYLDGAGRESSGEMIKEFLRENGVIRGIVVT